ncbi:hypothetical protein PsorP6_005663 [Peronosclerospora sorghi]|uniref:Uncharacterized protein n=1 Tax=Peronosclerospora sorghi TaxID=230839 RepID=A0ACC0W5F2_9STRA|nr:hypothetical protein PsorP6_005663 [Peronosclerospora sorghi]
MEADAPASRGDHGEVDWLSDQEMFTSDERDRVYDHAMEDAHVTQTQRAEAKYNVAASPRPAARSMKEEEAINDFALQRQSSRRFEDRMVDMSWEDPWTSLHLGSGLGPAIRSADKASSAVIPAKAVDTKGTPQLPKLVPKSLVRRRQSRMPVP